MVLGKVNNYIQKNIITFFISYPTQNLIVMNLNIKSETLISIDQRKS